jgi:hypothetical protein
MQPLRYMPFSATEAAFCSMTMNSYLIQTMTYKLAYGVVVDTPRKVIYAVRVSHDAIGYEEIHDIAERMRKRMLSKFGDQATDVVVVVGHTKETLHLFGEPYAVSRVRTAMFHASLSFCPIDLD